LQTLLPAMHRSSYLAIRTHGAFHAAGEISMRQVETHRQGHLHTFMRVLGIAAAYYVTGRLGLLLAIPPGYATPVWLPSGIALGAILIGGYRGWPGVLLGSWLLNMVVPVEAAGGMALLKAMVLPTSIGVGATLQAVVGAYLVRRVVGFPNPLSRERDIGAFLGLGGPVSCLTNATVGVTGLLIAGKIPWAAYFHHWWTWWVGDTIGVLIVTPLLLSWLAKPRDIWRRRRLSVAVPLLGAFALAVVVFVYTSHQEQERLQLAFERQAENIAQTLDNHLDRYLEVLRSIARFYASSQEVDREKFRTFVHDVLAHYPGIQALSWDRRVPDALREVYEQSVRQEGYADFQITEQDAQGRMVRAARRPEYVVVSYIEPRAGNEKALGYDVASDPGRIEVLQRTRDTGLPIATGRLMLVQETDHQFGLLVFLPIYSQDPPHATLEERRQHLLGYTTGVFQIGDMIEASLRGLEREGIGLRIEDEAAPAGQRTLYDSRATTGAALDDAHGENPIRMHWDTTVELAGRRWALRFTPTLAYLAARQSLQPWTVLVGGLSFTSLLGAFLLMVTGRTVLIEQLVAERTADLSRANTILAHEIAERQRVEEALREGEERFHGAFDNAPIGLALVAPDGRWLQVNRSLCDILGYTEHELLATTFQAITHPDDLAADLDYVRRMLADEIHVYQMEKRYFHKYGHIVWILLSVSLVRDVHGQPSYFISQIQDITQRKQVEEELQQTAVELTRSNAELAQFAYIASHDLQEPLHAVAGCVQMLQQRYQHTLDARADELITYAVGGVTQMQTLINDVLTYSRVGRHGVPLESADCAAILKRVLGNLDVAIRESSALVTSAALPTVRADPLLLGQVFQNLISNAIKFHGEGAPAVHIDVEQHEAAWMFAVRDHGIGIEPQYYDRIFEVFQRLHTRRAYPGTGIGLAICKKIVEHHGGRIWVESEPGKGATFFFTIPDRS
jgi:PAS domain S-box-containing protein